MQMYIYLELQIKILITYYMYSLSVTGSTLLIPRTRNKFTNLKNYITGSLGRWFFLY